MDGPLNIFVASESERHYATTLRIVRPLEVLKRQGLVEYAVHSFDPKNAALFSNMENADLIFAGNNANEVWNHFYRLFIASGKAVVMDMDDNPWDIHPFNHAYGTMGTQEVEVTVRGGGRRPLWRHGFDAFDVNLNRRNAMAIDECVNLVDAMTTTTDRLARKFAEKARRVFVLPNTVDLSLWRPFRLPVPGFRIGYQLSQSHKGDLDVMGPDVGEFCRRHPDVTLVTMGHRAVEWKAWIPEGQHEHHGWVDTDAYPAKMQTLGLDLGLAPLADNRFNRCKSAVKWTEYGAMQVPTLASAVPPYSDVVRDGEDGWLVPDGKWLDTLERLYADRKEIQRVGWNVRERVEREFDVEKEAHLWLDCFKSVLEEIPQRGARPPAPIHCLEIAGRMVH